VEAAQMGARTHLWDHFDYSAVAFAERVEYRQDNGVL